MKDEIKKDDLEFSEEELSELKHNLENRASVTQSGRPRRRTLRRGVVIPPTLLSGGGPAQERPRTKTLPFLGVTPSPAAAEGPAAAEAPGGGLEAAFTTVDDPPLVAPDISPVVTEEVVTGSLGDAAASAESPGLAAVATTQSLAGASESAQETEDTPAPAVKPPAPPVVAPAPLADEIAEEEEEQGSGDAAEGGGEATEQVAAPMADDAAGEPAPVAAEEKPVDEEADSAAEEQAATLEESTSQDPETAREAGQAATAEEHASDEAVATNEAEKAAARDKHSAVAVALEAAAEVLQGDRKRLATPTASDATFDLDDSANAPGASEAMEKLSERHHIPEAESHREERSNRVSILLSALRAPKKRVKEATEETDDRKAPSLRPLPKRPAASPATSPAPGVPPAQRRPAPPDASREREAPPFPLAEDLTAAPEEADGIRIDLDAEAAAQVPSKPAQEESAPGVPPPLPEDADESPFATEAAAGDRDVEQLSVPRVPSDEGIITSAVLDEEDVETLAAPPIPVDAAAPPPPPAADAAPPPPPTAEVAPPPPPTTEAVPPAPPLAAPRGAPPIPTGGPIPVEIHRIAPAQARPPAWYDEVFDEEYVKTAPFATPDTTRREVDFYELSLSPKAGSRILDLACGPGRHAIEFAARGYRVTGVDLSRPLLGTARDRAMARGIQLDLVHADVRDIEFDEEFDAAICVNTSFGFFDDDTNRKVIRSLNRALKTGGRLVLDVVNRDYVVSQLPGRIWWEGSGCVCLEEVEFNYFTSRLQSKRSVVFMDGRHIEQEMSMRLYSLHELGKILHHAGFRVLEVSGHRAHRSRFFGVASRSLILLAERRR